MQELVEKLKTNAGLTDEQAMKAIETMKDFIAGKVPPMFSGFVDSFFANGNKNDQNDSFLH
jgi:hypothetical protein